MHHREFFHLNRSIGFFSIDEIAKNLKNNGMWVNAVDDRDDTPLHIAAKINRMSFIRNMLPYFTDINACNSEGDTVLHIFIDNCIGNDNKLEIKPTNTVCSLISKSTFFDKKHRIIRTLLSKGADINLKNKQGVTAAHLAAKHGYIDILKIFKNSKKEMNVRTDSGENLLHVICKNMKSAWKDNPAEIEVMSYLIKQGCNVCAMDREGYSPLHYALQTRSVDTVKKLIQVGFDVQRWNKKILSNQLLAASTVLNPSVILFLIEQGADVNVKDASGKTPLHLASSRSFQRYQTMEVLLKSGAHVDVQDNDGHLPLDYALQHGNVKGLECLMEFGVDVIHTPSFKRIPIGRILNGKPLENFVLKHLIKLQAAGFKVKESYKSHLNRKDLQIYKRICLEEVKELKVSMVDDNTSLYDLLHMKMKHCRYTYLPKLLRNLKCSFPLYYGIIRIRIYEMEKKSLIKPATVAWYQLTNINLPYICVENILSHLNSCCLKMMINSTEDNILYNSVLLQAKLLDESHDD